MIDDEAPGELSTWCVVATLAQRGHARVALGNEPEADVDAHRTQTVLERRNEMNGESPARKLRMDFEVADVRDSLSSTSHARHVHRRRDTADYAIIVGGDQDDWFATRVQEREEVRAAIDAQ